MAAIRRSEERRRPLEASFSLDRAGGSGLGKLPAVMELVVMVMHFRLAVGRLEDPDGVDTLYTLLPIPLPIPEVDGAHSPRVGKNAIALARAVSILQGT